VTDSIASTTCTCTEVAFKDERDDESVSPEILVIPSNFQPQKALLWGGKHPRVTPAGTARMVLTTSSFFMSHLRPFEK
jgi:hypothetical protein